MGRKTVKILALLLLLALSSNASTSERPRYTLIDNRVSFLFSNHDTLPFQVIRRMCWNDETGFCDEGLEGARESHFLIDWEAQSYGAIFRTEGGACFWWMYQSEWGSDSNPHILQHEWIGCPDAR